MQTFKLLIRHCGSHIFFNCYFMVKISIITSCFNREATIRQTIEADNRKRIVSGLCGY